MSGEPQIACLRSEAWQQEQATLARQVTALERLAARFDTLATRAPGSARSREAAELRLICWRVREKLHEEQRRGLDR